MSALLAVTLAAAIQPSCSWDHPGRNPYTGTTAAAIDRYTDIPAAVRSTLKRRMEEHQSDDTVSITRDSISGKNQYNPTIRSMHFGAASVCGTVTRDKWAETRNESGAVYCVGEHCILVPKICGNVSRISKIDPAAAQKPAVAARHEGDEQKPAQFADMHLEDPESRDPTLSADDLNDLDPESAAKRRLAQAQNLAQALTQEQDDQARSLRNGGGGGGGGGASEGEGAVSPVPEPDTWAMLLAGLGLVGWAARRRARRATDGAE
ncbi:PEPxxWA-CTERM sorting domain-containing protein [Duganella sp. FT80W]|uniref:PEPxxWA-CTERM sorting domain-containing protein n=1 Tax=Duganella guangzhouensis TaxID=2666084 RepID=A0A6I2KYF6_9BURK|nr:MHFG family PEP-CTERM protein [Duganella guangzhouensis]MRW90017.1 PEPxxWA-CTERM sorting domain-containing protein [Duganella guangzhouensis]